MEPNGQPAPWLTIQAWGHVYRPYLGFLYLNNAYHFYSPEPGPPTLLWYRVEYASGETQWFRMPDRRHDPMPLHYQRLLALTESINQIKGPGAVDQVAWMSVETNRRRAGFLHDIPLHPDPTARQYAEPQDVSKLMTSTYARHLARTTVNPNNPDDKVVRVRMYRVVHVILSPAQVAEGVDPRSEWLYLPYFQGEFDADGKLTDPGDPFLYWLIPIYKDPQNPSVVHNCLKMHDKVDLRKDAEPKEEVQP
jgi:hypothetical protein